MKNLIKFLSDRKVLIGIGIGILIATISMMGVKPNYNLSRYEVELKAREYGMEYKDEQKVIQKNKNISTGDVKK